MGNCCSGDRIPIPYTDITIYNIEEPEQKYRLGMVSNKLLGWGGGGGLKHDLLDQNPRP